MWCTSGRTPRRGCASSDTSLTARRSIRTTATCSTRPRTRENATIEPRAARARRSSRSGRVALTLSKLRKAARARGAAHVSPAPRVGHALARARGRHQGPRAGRGGHDAAAACSREPTSCSPSGSTGTRARPHARLGGLRVRSHEQAGSPPTVGRAVARLHAAGIAFPDLFAKHVYLKRAGRWRVGRRVPRPRVRLSPAGGLARGARPGPRRARGLAAVPRRRARHRRASCARTSGTSRGWNLRDAWNSVASGGRGGTFGCAGSAAGLSPRLDGHAVAPAHVGDEVARSARPRSSLLTPLRRAGARGRRRRSRSATTSRRRSESCCVATFGAGVLPIGRRAAAPSRDRRRAASRGTRGPAARAAPGARDPRAVAALLPAARDRAQRVLPGREALDPRRPRRGSDHGVRAERARPDLSRCDPAARSALRRWSSSRPRARRTSPIRRPTRPRRSRRSGRTAGTCTSTRASRGRGVDLSGLRLEHASFEGADLRGAVLDRRRSLAGELHPSRPRGASLGGCQLQVANFKDANLAGADLSGSHLEGTTMSGADLSGADLSQTKLVGAQLRGSASQRRVVPRRPALPHEPLERGPLARRSQRRRAARGERARCHERRHREDRRDYVGGRAAAAGRPPDKRPKNRPPRPSEFKWRRHRRRTAGRGPESTSSDHVWVGTATRSKRTAGCRPATLRPVASSSELVTCPSVAFSRPTRSSARARNLRALLQHPHLGAHLRERRDGAVEVLPACAPPRSGRGSAPGPSARPGRRTRSRRCPRRACASPSPARARASPSMIGTIGWTPGRIAKPAAVICSRKHFVFASRRSRSSACPREQVDARDRRRDDRRRERVREEVRAAALPQEVDDLLRGAGEAARRAAERLAERRGEDVDAARDAAVLRASRARSCRRSPSRGCRRPSRSPGTSRRGRRCRFRSAMSPSIEKTPSVAISRERRPCVAFRCASSSPRSPCV